MKTTRISLFLVMVVLFLSATVALGQAVKSGNKAKANIQAPEPVLTAFHKAYPKAVVRNILEEVKDGTTYYEIESMDGNQRRDLLYFADGNVYEIEESWEISRLPQVVATALNSKFPQGKLQKVERITRAGTIQYEVLLEDGEDNLEVLLDSKGTIISQATADDMDEESDSGESDEADED